MEEQQRPRFGSRRSDRILVAVVVISVLVLAGGLYGVIKANEGSGPPVIPFTIAFETTTGKAGQIQQINRDGSLKGLTDGNSLDEDPSWSPDGKNLLFTRNGAIYIRDEGGTRSLLDTTTASTPHWSPDGTKIAYSDQTPQTAQQGFLWIMDADGSNAHPVFSESTLPTNCVGGFVGGWYPGGDRILYRGSYPDGSLALCSVKTDGTDVQTIVHDDAGKALNSSPALSPDGTKLAFASNRDGSNRIYIANADGTNPTVFLSQTGSQDYPAWSSDGLWLAYSSNALGAYHVYAARADGSGAIQLTSGPQDIHPTWGAAN